MIEFLSEKEKLSWILKEQYSPDADVLSKFISKAEKGICFRLKDIPQGRNKLKKIVKKFDAIFIDLSKILYWSGFKSSYYIRDLLSYDNNFLTAYIPISKSSDNLYFEVEINGRLQNRKIINFIYNPYVFENIQKTGEVSFKLFIKPGDQTLNMIKTLEAASSIVRQKTSYDQINRFSFLVKRVYSQLVFGKKLIDVKKEFWDDPLFPKKLPKNLGLYNLSLFKKVITKLDTPHDLEKMTGPGFDDYQQYFLALKSFNSLLDSNEVVLSYLEDFKYEIQ